MRAQGVGRPREMRLMRTGMRIGSVSGSDFLRSARFVEGWSWVRPLGGTAVDDDCLMESPDDESLEGGPSISLRQSQAHPWPTSPFLPFPKSTASQLVRLALGLFSQSAFRFLLSSISQSQPALVPG